MTIYLKVHRSYRSVVAICDSELIGKKFEEGKRQLYLRENFYQGDLLSEEETINQIRKQAMEDSTFNIVGEKSTEAAIKAGVITKESIDKINGVPFALTLI